MPQKRIPLVEHVPKTLKRGNRTAAPGIPANIRVDGLTLDESDRDYIRRRLGEKLGRYAGSVERISVRLRDINGPRGGVDVRCRIKVVLSGLPSIVVEQQNTAFRPALTEALASVERAVRRTLQRKRTRPLRAKQ
ncbi:MAG: HPF/RaiA family ribosome-associated protein [Gemmatimonadaceae bacterium]|nr:HPF/RaiA family ribosome-associated protein [Gemmatimonadaceae bacterium]